MKAAFLGAIFALVAICTQSECAAWQRHEVLISTANELLLNQRATLSIDIGVMPHDIHDMLNRARYIAHCLHVNTVPTEWKLIGATA